MRRLCFLFAGIILLTACSQNNVEEDTIAKKYFEENKLSGSFVLFNNANNSFQIYNLPEYKDSAYAPGTNFNIINALIAIETGVVTDENTPLEVNGIPTTLNQAWNKNAAFFDTLATKVEKNKMQLWLDSLHYGKAKTVANDPIQFWKNGTLKITADEQLGLIKQLHFNQLFFQKRTQAIAENLLKVESNSLYNLYYNKGIAQQQSGLFTAIITGYIIENKHVYFFSLTAKSVAQNQLVETGEQMLRNILKEYGFFEGKK